MIPYKVSVCVCNWYSCNCFTTTAERIFVFFAPLLLRTHVWIFVCAQFFFVINSAIKIYFYERNKSDMQQTEKIMLKHFFCINCTIYLYISNSF